MDMTTQAIQRLKVNRSREVLPEKAGFLLEEFRAHVITFLAFPLLYMGEESHRQSPVHCSSPIIAFDTP
jgi:hypothetical protein